MPARLPTISKVTNEALLEADARKGITLVGIYKAIENKYSADITPLRKTLIKKHLNGLIASKEVKNITGRGLTGHLKLVNKKEFSNKINSTRAVRRKTVTNPDVRSLRRPKTTEQPVNTTTTVPDYQSPPPLSQTYDFEEPGTSQQLIRRRNMPHLFNLNEHDLDTPLMAPQHASTPIPQTQFLPLAPNRQHISHPRQLSSDVLEGAPRTSLPSSGRKKGKRNLRQSVN
ncbi:uncharacterized protein [Musca autumnalis]|uniref:uncharacterized protein n=1 Tax=Musca autumnalis TaxID=221902 RepID=UPI003CF580D1